MKRMARTTHRGLRKALAVVTAFVLVASMASPGFSAFANDAGASGSQGGGIAVADGDNGGLAAAQIADEPITVTYEDDAIKAQASLSVDALRGLGDAGVSGDDLCLSVAQGSEGLFADVAVDDSEEFAAFDVRLCDDQGKQVDQPIGDTELTVAVNVADDGRPAAIRDVEVFHYVEGSAPGCGYSERLDSDAVSCVNGEICFQAGEMGSYAVRYTVDYYFDGLECHMYGDSRMLLSELFGQLGIAWDAADVVAIDFTNPDVLAFERYDDESDWVIQSTGPFSTWEVLTVTFANGYVLQIDVTDDGAYTESTKLEDFLISWKIVVGDVEYNDDNVDDSTVIEYKEGMQYSLELMFMEKPSLGFSTPETDPPHMVFQLPDGFHLPENWSMPLNIDLGRKGVLPNNILTVQKAEGTDGKEHYYLHLSWNWTDTTHWNFFRDSAQARLKITLTGTLGGNDPEVLSINGKEVALRIEDPHNAVVNKEGVFNRNTGIIDYTVTVSSQGTTSDISLTDILGSALTYLTDAEHGGGIVYDAANSVNSTGTTPQITQKTGNTFSVVIPSMVDGDTLVFNYSASVDYDGIAISGNPSFEETGNTAQIFGDSYTLDNTAMYHETNIEFSDLEKNCIDKRRQSINGNSAYILTWEIDTNKRAQYPLADTTITDTIGAAIQDFSRYTGAGVTVKCYSEDGVLQEARQLAWDDLGVDLANDVTWTYHIPDTDPLYHYVLTYDTIVYMDDQAETVVAENTAEGKGGIDSDRAVLTVPGTSGIGVSKKATNLDSKHVTWEITLTVSGASLDYQRFVLVEHSDDKTVNNRVTWNSNTLPARWLTLPGETTSRLVKEQLKKVEVDGLLDGETFEVTYGRATDESDRRHYSPAEGSNVLEADFVGYKYGGDYCSLEFFKDYAKTETGLVKPDGESPSRTIVVRLTTEFPEEWATYARDITVASAARSSYPFSHINWISVETPNSNGTLTTRAYDTDKIMPMPPNVYKSVLRHADTTASDVRRDYFILNYPDCIVTNWVGTGANYPDLPSFPVFYYMVLVNGIQYDEPLVIEDSYDTSLFDLITADELTANKAVMTEGSRQGTHNYFPCVFGMSEYRNWAPDSNSGIDYVRYKYGHGTASVPLAEDHGCTLEKTDTGFRITINEPFKRADGSLYPFYGIDYYLIPKNLEALKTIEEMARSNAMAGGEPKATFTNTASSRGTKASANVKIGITNDFMPIDKTSETYLDLLNSYNGQSRIQLQDATIAGQTVRDTPDGITSEDIKHYVMKYRVVLNKGKERLNEGNPITAEDEYSSNLSVDFTTISITTDPVDAASEVSYDYSGNVGYFTIPDETKVVIEYEAVVLNTTAAIVSVSNEVRMLQYKKSLEDYVDHGGAGGSSATNPGIFVKKYGSGHMEKGLNGARFQLFEYNHETYARGDSNTAADWTPVTLTVPVTRDAIFTTGNLTIGETNYGDGYADISLSQEGDGTTLQLGKVYGLREIETPVATAPNGDTINYHNPHSDSFYCYIFTICEDGETADYSNFVYLPDDTMTVRNTPESTTLHMRKVLAGNCTLTDAEKNSLTYQLFRKHKTADDQPARYMPIMTHAVDPGTGQEVEVVDTRFVNIAYSQVAGDSGVDLTGLTVESGATVGEYLLVEYGNDVIKANHPDWTWRGTYEWSGGGVGNFTNTAQTVYDENAENPRQVQGVEFTVTSQEIKDGDIKSVALINTYTRETVNLTANKRWLSPSGSAIAWPSGKSVAFTLGTLDESDAFTAVPGVAAVVLDNQKDANGEETAGSAVFKNLPKYEVYDDDGTPRTREIRYAVRETTSASGYNVVYPAVGVDYAAFGGGTAVTIKNQVVSTSISASKAWDRGLVPAAASATFRLYAYTGSDSSAASWVSNVNDITLDGVVDGGTFGETAVAWRADFTGLPLYDGNGVELHYLVKEISCIPAGYEPIEEFVGNGGTITNKPASTVFTIDKRWSGTSGNAWPSSEEITLTLARKTRAGVVDDSFSSAYVLSADAIVSQDAITDMYGDSRQTGTWTGVKLTVVDLPKYDDSGNEWLYYAEETAIRNAGGTDVSGNYTTVYRDKNNYLLTTSYAYSGGSVTNTLSTKELMLSKAVSGNMGDTTKAFRFTITLRNQDLSLYAGDVAYSRENADSSTVSGTLSLSDGSAVVSLKHGEAITLKDLPSGLRYTVEESADDANGYQTAYTANGSAAASGRSVNGSLSANTTLACTNTRQVLIPGGVRHEVGMLSVALPIFAASIALLLRKRRAFGTRRPSR